MAIQTVIMAGGEGVRLRPLTQSCPKPLAPMCGEAVMGYALKLLRRHGIDQAHATLWYRPQDVVRAFGTGRHGVELSYSIEDTPLGTAGSVRKAVQKKETTLVLSGDGLTGCDLTQALHFHRASGAMATIVLTKVEIPLQYGVVVVDQSGRIRRFIEKPDWSRVIGSLVNTGIYLLEPEALALIPPDRPYDFGRELFPQMLEMGLPLYGYVSQEYWCDVGDPAAFLRAQGDLLMGCTGFVPSDYGQRALRDGFISCDSYVSPQARIAPDAVIENSCILPGVLVESGARIKGSILCAGARVGRGAVLTEGSVLGAGAQAGDFSNCEGGRIFAGVHTSAGEVIRGVIMQGDERLTLRAGKAWACGPEEIARLAGAYLQAEKIGRVAVMHEENQQARAALWKGALAVYGAQQVQDLGSGTQGMLGFYLRREAFDGGVLVTKKGAALLDSAGCLLDDAASARVLSLAQRCEAPAMAESPAPFASENIREAYLQWLKECFAVVTGQNICLNGTENAYFSLVRDALVQCGHRLDTAGETRLHVINDRLQLQDARLPQEEDKRWLLCAEALQNAGQQVYDTHDLGILAPNLTPYDCSQACRAQEAVWADALAQVLMLLWVLEKGRLSEGARSLARRSITIPCASEYKGQVLEALIAEASPSQRGGLQLCRTGAQAHIRPDPILPLLRVTACAVNAENAEELCDFCSDRIKTVLQQNEKIGNAASPPSA